MQRRTTLGTFLWDRGARLSLEQEVYVAGTFLNFFHGPAQRLLVECLTTLTHEIHCCLARNEMHDDVITS